MDQPSDQPMSTSPAVKLNREEEEYLDKLLSEKKIVDATTGLDCTQKLINAGKT